MLIVEDEAIQRRAMAKTLADHSPEAEILTARDGEEALQTARRRPPDVAFLDIRMPRQDGLSAAGELRRIAPGCVLYVITAHEEFAYAQQAVNLGVEEYLLKPVSGDDLARCMRLVGERLDAARAAARREAELRRTLADAMPLLRSEFARDLCLGAIGSTQEYAGRAQLFDFDAEPNVAVSTGLRPPSAPAGSSGPGGRLSPGVAREVELEVLRRKAAAAIEKLAASLHPGALAARIAHDEVVVLVPLSRSRLGQRPPRTALHRLLAGIFEAVSEAGLEAAVGIGGLAGGALTLWRSYRGAVRARQRAWLLGRVPRRVLSADDLGEAGDSLGSYPLLAERGLAEAVRLGIGEEAGRYLSQLDDYFAGLKSEPEDVAAGRSRLLECMAVIARAAIEGGAPAVAVLESSSGSIDSALQAEGPKSFGAVLSHAAGQLADLVRSSLDRRRGTLAARAAAYLEGHFPEPVSLTQISDELHVSPFYLSHVFHEEIGVTFSEYLTGVRIKEAQRLLSTTDLSIGQIAARVGYREPNYFGRVFKKATGMTPLAWRRQR